MVFERRMGINMGLYQNCVNHMTFLAFLKAFLNTPKITHLVLEKEHIFPQEQMCKKNITVLIPFCLQFRLLWSMWCIFLLLPMWDLNFFVREKYFFLNQCTCSMGVSPLLFFLSFLRSWVLFWIKSLDHPTLMCFAAFHMVEWSHSVRTELILC